MPSSEWKRMELRRNKTRTTGLTPELLPFCKAVCIGKGTTRGHFTAAGITDVRSISENKNGVGENASSVNCAVSICEVKGKPDQV